MALSSFSLWDKALQGGLGMGFSFFSFPMLLVRLETSPQLLGSTCTSLREGGCLCIDMGWLEQPIPQKHQLGRGTPVDPWLQGREGERPWDGAPGNFSGRTQSSQIPLECPGWIHVGLASFHLHLGAHPRPNTERIPGKHNLGNLFWQPRLPTGPAAVASGCGVPGAAPCLRNGLLLDYSVPHIW